MIDAYSGGTFYGRRNYPGYYNFLDFKVDYLELKKGSMMFPCYTIYAPETAPTAYKVI